MPRLGVSRLEKNSEGILRVVRDAEGGGINRKIQSEFFYIILIDPNEIEIS
jgi:hypothetical protein